MATVDVLITGYVNEDDEGEHVQPTVSLVRSGDVVLIVDPGILSSVGDLHDSLGRQGISATDITHVFLTHHHIDHTRNIGVFPSAIVIDGDSVYRGDIWDEHQGDGHEVAEGVTIMSSPGHSPECATLLVATDEGTVALTHAWWFADRSPVEDPMASDQQELETSRRKILEVADVVIPGHGPAFRI